jgi:MFS family permease
VAGWAERDKGRLVSTAFFLVIGVSIVGNFVAAWLARRIGYRRAVAVLCVAFFAALVATYGVPRDHRSVLRMLPWVGLCSGVFGLFTMYLPPLFPVLLRTTGAGFSYNVGRVAAAFGTVFFGVLAPVADLRLALLAVAFLFLPAAAVALLMPDLRDDPAPAPGGPPP